MTPEQHRATGAILDRWSGDLKNHSGARDGYSVFMYPTTRTPTFIECRMRDTLGRIIKREQAWPPKE